MLYLIIFQLIGLSLLIGNYNSNFKNNTKHNFRIAEAYFIKKYN